MIFKYAFHIKYTTRKWPFSDGKLPTDAKVAEFSTEYSSKNFRRKSLNKKYLIFIFEISNGNFTSENFLQNFLLGIFWQIDFPMEFSSKIFHQKIPNKISAINFLTEFLTNWFSDEISKGKFSIGNVFLTLTIF